jgi:hypothetical protein
MTATKGYNEAGTSKPTRELAVPLISPHIPGKILRARVSRIFKIRNSIEY